MLRRPPISTRTDTLFPYTTLFRSVGDLATLFRLDTRIEGREQPFDLGKVMAGKQSAEEIVAALGAFRDGAWADPQRQLLGAAQEGWLGTGQIGRAHV